jgi:hypothetical protein
MTTSNQEINRLHLLITTKHIVKTYVNNIDCNMIRLLNELNQEYINNKQIDETEVLTSLITFLKEREYNNIDDIFNGMSILLLQDLYFYFNLNSIPKLKLCSHEDDILSKETIINGLETLENNIVNNMEKLTNDCIDTTNTIIFNKLDEINTTISDKLDTMADKLDTIDITILDKMNALDTTLIDKLNMIDSTILSELNTNKSDDDQELFTNKLNNIESELININTNINDLQSNLDNVESMTNN